MPPVHPLHDNGTCLSTEFIENLAIKLNIEAAAQAGTILTVSNILIVTALAVSVASSITVFLVRLVQSFKTMKRYIPVTSLGKMWAHCLNNNSPTLLRQQL